MPCTAEAVDVFRKANVLIAPAIAGGAGGVSSLFDSSFINLCLMSLPLLRW